MDRVTRFNVIAMSGKAVEACGDVDVMILDKTGTITFGNRLAADFIPLKAYQKDEMIKYYLITSIKDTTPEGKSTIDLGAKLGFEIDEKEYAQDEFIEFTAQTKSSGVKLKNGQKIRKGATSAIMEFVKNNGGTIPKDLKEKVDSISSRRNSTSCS